MTQAEPPEATTAAILEAGLPTGDRDAAEIAGFLRHPLTLVDAVPTPFLRRYRVFRVMPRHLSHPILRHVAGGQGLSTHILGVDPATLADVVREDGSTLDSAADAVSYAEVLLEVVSLRPGLMRIVSAVDEIPFRENLGDADLAAKASAEASLDDRIRAPQAVRSGDKWDVTLWVARDASVRRETLELALSGDLVQQEVAETYDLPLITVA